MRNFIYGLLTGITLAWFITIANAQTTTNPYQSQGQANTTGSTTYYTGPYGEPRGSASTYGNSTYYYNQYGQPLGSSSTYGAPSTNPPPSYNPYGSNRK